MGFWNLYFLSMYLKLFMAIAAILTKNNNDTDYIGNKLLCTLLNSFAHKVSLSVGLNMG